MPAFFRFVASCSHQRAATRVAAALEDGVQLTLTRAALSGGKGKAAPDFRRGPRSRLLFGARLRQHALQQGVHPLEHGARVFHHGFERRNLWRGVHRAVAQAGREPGFFIALQQLIWPVSDMRQAKKLAAINSRKLFQWLLVAFIGLALLVGFIDALFYKGDTARMLGMGITNSPSIRGD
jgi:hypothetical protein